MTATPVPAAGTGDEREGLREALVSALGDEILRQTLFTRDGARKVADALLAGPLADLVAKVARVEALASYPDAHTEYGAAVHIGTLRRALDGTEGANVR